MKRCIVLFLVFCVAVTSVFSTLNGRPSVAVVLSGGGAKGIAHIAVLEELERLGIPIDMVLGTSMGALIGGLYCAGYSPGDIRRVVENNDLKNLFTTFESSGYVEMTEPFSYDTYNILNLEIGKGVGKINGLIDDYKIMNFFNETVGNVPKWIRFDNLVVPFRCIGVNAVTGEKIVFKDGSIIDAMRGSMSIPLAFKPYELADGTLVFDGGLKDNMPAKLAREYGFDIVICENVNAKLGNTRETYESLSGTAGGVFSLIVSGPVKEQIQYADIVLEPDLTGIGTLDFGKAEESIKRGEEAVRQCYDALLEIAESIPEDKREHKDPNRQGEYFTKWEERAVSKAQASTEYRKSRALHDSRVSIGLFGTGSLSFDFKEGRSKSPVLNVIPTFAVKVFLHEIQGSNYSMSTAVKIGNGMKAEYEGFVLLDDDSEGDDINLYFRHTFVLDAGSISIRTNRLNLNEDIVKSSGDFDDFSIVHGTAVRGTEFGIRGSAGIKVTDEKDINSNFAVKADVFFLKNDKAWDPGVFPELFNSENGRYTLFFPKLELAFIRIGDYIAEQNGVNGLRADLGGRVGRTVFKDKKYNFWTYKLIGAFEDFFQLSDKSLLGVELFAQTSREPRILTESYTDYGGSYGVPGYSCGFFVRDCIMGGVSYDYKLADGLIEPHLLFQLKAGFRSNDEHTAFLMPYELMHDELGERTDSNVAPFSGCKGGLWDVGLFAGYRLGSRFGEIVIGAGINQRLRFSLYLEIH
ncbi:MAG: patatin-like phospholipase family protein [Sphaerochaetaceae bacterium]|nr:patatin-like phospholipase family protein [Sphaerochaetaceae bacterium]